MLKGTERQSPRRCCTLGVDDTIIETSEEALYLAISSCDGGSEGESLYLGVETDGKVLAIRSSEVHEDNDPNSSEDFESVARWEIVGSKDKVQVFLPSGCDKKSGSG